MLFLLIFVSPKVWQCFFYPFENLQLGTLENIIDVNVHVIFKLEMFELFQTVQPLQEVSKNWCIPSRSFKPENRTTPLGQAFQQAHERLPRVFELLALFKGWEQCTWNLLGNLPLLFSG